MIRKVLGDWLPDRILRCLIGPILRVAIGNLQNTVFPIDVAAPGDSRLALKLNEKCERYIDLKIEIQRMWNMHAVIVPVVIARLGSVPACLATNFWTFNIYNGSLISNGKLPYWVLNCHIS